MKRWATVKRIHQAALEREAGQRATFLDEAYAGDEALRREVESLLAYQEAAEPFLESPALEVTARSASQEPSIPLAGLPADFHSPRSTDSSSFFSSASIFMVGLLTEVLLRRAGPSGGTHAGRRP
jgi:hypothetical protein